MSQHDLKLVISADTSDAEKKIKDIGKVTVDPIKPTVKQPDPIKPKVKQPDPIKPKVVQPKPVTVQAKFESTGFGAFVKQLHGVREIASKVMASLGIIGFSVGVVMSVVSAFQMLKEKVEATKKAVAKMRFDAAMRDAASETNRLVTAHERLAKVLKDEMDTLAKQKAVGDISKGGRRDLEDGRRAAARARQIYAAQTPEQEQALRDRFAVEDAQIADRRTMEDRRERVSHLDNEESVFSAQAKGARDNQGKIDAQIAVEEFNVRRARGRRKDGEEMSEEEKAARARVKALEERKKANEEEIAQFEKEARFRRDQIAAINALGTPNAAEAVKAQQAQAKKEKRRETERETTKADAEWKDRRARETEKKETEAAVESQTNDVDKKAILDAQANNKRIDAADLRRQYDEEMKRDPGERDAEKLADLRSRIDALEADAEGYEKSSRDITKAEKEKRKAEAESFADRFRAADGVSQNRLTAMGLGSGVSSGRDVSSDVRKLVDLLKQNVDATKSIKIPETSNAGVFAE